MKVAIEILIKWTHVLIGVNVLSIDSVAGSSWVLWILCILTIKKQYSDIEFGAIGDQGEYVGSTDIRSPIGTLIIDVIDSGVGIAEGDQDRLFKEIVQFNPSVLQGGGGSGLGMMVSFVNH